MLPWLAVAESVGRWGWGHGEQRVRHTAAFAAVMAVWTVVASWVGTVVETEAAIGGVSQRALRLAKGSEYQEGLLRVCL